MQMKSKKATFFSDQPIAMVVAAVAVFVMLVLLYNLLSPNFDREEETAKSYLRTFNKQLETADRGETGEFRFWDLGEERRDYYFVYFGEKFVRRAGLGGEVIEFVLKKKLSNGFCICFIEEGRGICNICSSSDYPLEKRGSLGLVSGNEEIILGSEDIVKITKEEKKYILEVKKDVKV